MGRARTYYPVAVDVIVGVVAAVLLALASVLFFMCRRRRVAQLADEEGKPFFRPPLQSFPFGAIDAATDGFNPHRFLRKGRLGTVYMAVAESGEFLAVKRINPHLVLSNAGLSFSSRIRSLSSAYHPNVVPILGYSEAPGERILVLEFVGMKSLDLYLHQDVLDSSSMLLDWGLRLRIAAGAARGIEHLHEGTAPHIVHGSVKPSNIMIDKYFSARVCDYGLSFLASQETRGLEGYLDGEWGDEEQDVVCKASDVYGFGVVLLELLSGRRCEGGSIVEYWALPLIRSYKLAELLDPRLRLPVNMKPLLRLAKVASACVGNSRKSRPSIVQVAAILNNLEMQPLC
ncbi:hypothetical protein Taro_001551 [Colocasia esculenta]|uniref:Protein kinase domain-containing protein n=1 Tax=Colocasia esculenta TaxID=4460 RepID=A0A843TEV4_COLES|nr:hypothetical protein [Colocasia esculenta]